MARDGFLQILERLAGSGEDLEWLGSLDRADGTGDSGVFGSVTDALVAREGVLVLDQRMGRVSLYSPDGILGTMVAGPGRGPGELVDPRALAWSEQQLAVVDVTARIHYYRPPEYRYVESVPVDLEIRDLCEMHEGLFVHGFSPTKGGLVHLVRGGTLVRSFGLPYRSENEIVRDHMSEGQIECDDERMRVYLALKRVGELLAYDLNGRLLWAARMDPFLPPLVRQLVDGGVVSGIDPRRGEMHDLRRATLIDGRHLVVQYSRYTTGSVRTGRGIEPSAVDTWVVDVDELSGWYAGSEIPVILDADSAVVVVTRNDPFPAVAFVGVEGARR